MVGSALLIVSIVALGLGIAARNRTAIITSAAGLLLMGLAYMSGTIFLADIEKDAYSFSMALGFIGSLVSYGLAVYLTQPTRKIT